MKSENFVQSSHEGIDIINFERLSEYASRRLTLALLGPFICNSRIAFELQELLKNEEKSEQNSSLTLKYRNK